MGAHFGTLVCHFGLKKHTFAGPGRKPLPTWSRVTVQSSSHLSVKRTDGGSSDELVAVSIQCMSYNNHTLTNCKGRNNEPINANKLLQVAIRSSIHTRMNSVDTQVQGFLCGHIRNMSPCQMVVC